ncbi:hypothetical protein J6590_072356, partial [Homalodisca vitripennis]
YILDPGAFTLRPHFIHRRGRIHLLLQYLSLSSYPTMVTASTHSFSLEPSMLHRLSLDQYLLAYTNARTEIRARIPPPAVIRFYSCYPRSYQGWLSVIELFRFLVHAFVLVFTKTLKLSVLR